MVLGSMKTKIPFPLPCPSITRARREIPMTAAFYVAAVCVTAQNKRLALSALGEVPIIGHSIRVCAWCAALDAGFSHGDDGIATMRIGTFAAIRASIR